MAVAYAPITGSVLEWAIRDAGVSAGELADRVEATEAQLRGWMYEDSQPSTKQLKNLAKALSRPESFFFLEGPPKKQPTPAEFRHFAGSNGRPGPQTLEGIKLARRVQKTHAWIRQRGNEDPISLPEINASQDVEIAAGIIQVWLDWSTSAQTGGTEAATAKEFRNALQAKGILALNLTLDENATRGFSLHHSYAPLVAANTRDPHPARLFSYAHELVHLCLGEDAVCGTNGSQKGIERFCNRVAAALLMPKRAFVEYKNLKFGSVIVSEIKQVTTIKNHFRVSMRAASIRLEGLGLASRSLYSLVDNTATVDKKSSGGRYTPGQERTRPVIRVDQYGHEFINNLFGAEKKGLLRRRQISELLSVSEKELNHVQQLSSAGVDA
ncbi:ImmA/IrrE family metallo-endopeptidase [Rhodococcus sp. KBS0724]|uniref:ImmA/IrrE family metallo-endopeptidase n=1 Tax=Rhodococcus sp. KBS0724 TaxID=1179674 RepID=UPI00110F4B5F|nr:ImmA/IrrE family metallo-endopeptidase [Rhodococcus sp. KBS0724]TSD40508.1 ImmA/IrrE family metallo-endopeptidase [Rhodococcus sp. KBS0724]